MLERDFLLTSIVKSTIQASTSETWGYRNVRTRQYFMQPIIRVQSLGKRYLIGGPTVPYSTIRETIVEFARKPLRSLRYNGTPPAIWALKDIDFEIAPGEIVGIIGRNGAGKSTLLKSIAGAERPRSGTVSFDGARIDGMAQHVITSRGIAYVPENRRLFPRLSVRDNLRLGSYLFRGQADREEPLDLVFQLFPRLQERLEQRAETLSGGEQQMLAISRALMTRPRLLMLDEPSQGIMPKLVDEIFQAVKRIRDAGMTVLIVEQRMSECLEIADRAYILQTGRVLMQGSAADIRVNPDVRKAYLGL